VMAGGRAEKEPEEEGRPSGSVTWVETTPIGTRVGLDPCTGYVAGPEAEAGLLLFEGLVGKGVLGETLPRLAKSWEIAPDWNYVDFTLMKGIKFHNGEAFTAEDVKFSLDRYMNPKYMWIFNSHIKEYINRVEVLDDYHVRFYFTKPWPAFFHVAAYFMTMLPKDYIEEVGDEVFAYNPVGTGPGRFVKLKKDEFVHLEAVENHWRQTFDFKDFYQVTSEDASTNLAMLRTGEADIIRLDLEHIPAVEADPNLRTIPIKHSKMVSIMPFDIAYPEPTPWKDARVRKAAVLGVDRESIAKNLMHGAGEPWKSFLPPYCLGFDPSIKPDPYDPKRARELMAEAGYADGFDTTFFIFPEYQFMEAFVSYWAEVGIRAKFELVDVGEWRARVTSQKERGTITYTSEPYWVGGSHPCTALADLIGSWMGVPVPDWFKKAYNKCCEARTEKEIIQAGREIEILMRESGYWMPMLSFHEILGVGPKIKSFDPPQGMAEPTRFEYIKLNKK